VNNLNLKQLRQIILDEVKELVDEDAVFRPPMHPGDHLYAKFRYDDDHDDHDDYDDYGIYDDMCPECGDYHDYIDGDGSCPHGKSTVSYMISEGDCGCGSKPEEGGDYSLDSMNIIRSMMGHGQQQKNKSHSHKGSSYMAKPQLAKISKYAHKLHSMISDNEELQDWQESKIAQISQMIGDVYHSIEYKKSKGHH